MAKYRRKNKLKNGGQFLDGVKDTGMFIADTSLSGLAPNLIDSDQYNRTKLGETYGKVSAVHEGFSDQSPLAKATSGLKIGGEKGEGMTMEEKRLYNKSSAISKPINQATESVIGMAVPVTKPMFSVANSLNTNPSGQIDVSDPLRADQKFGYVDPGSQYNNFGYAMGGELTEYKGFKHENGGIPLGATNNEVESGETRGMPNGSSKDYIFSDKLKAPGKKYTFAKASKMIENKYSRRDGDKLSDAQKELEINNLMGTQESLREKMMLNSYKKAYGGMTNGGEEKTDWMSKVGPLLQMAMKGYQMYKGGGFAYGGELGGPSPNKYGSFNPNNGNVHNLQKGEKPLTNEQLIELGFAPIDANSEQEASYPRGRYKVNKYNPEVTVTGSSSGMNVKPYLNHSKQMDTNPAYRKAYFEKNPQMVPGYITPPTFALGGELNRAEDFDSEKKPYPSVQSNDFAGGNRSYPIPTKADAVDALRLAGLHGRSDVKTKVYSKYPSLKHDDGGKLNFAPTPYHDQGFNMDKFTPDYNPYAKSLAPFDVTTNNINQFNNPGTLKNAPQGQFDFGSGQNYLGTDTNNGTFSTPDTQNTGGNNFDPNSLYNAGNFLGAGYDIYRGLKGGDKVDYEKVAPETVNYQVSRDMARRDIKEGFNEVRNNLKANVGGAEYLSLLGQTAINRDRTIADTIAKSYENEANTNAQLRNTGKYFNAQTQMQEANARQQEKDVASNTLSTGLYNAGSATAQAGRDKKAYASQDEAKRLIGTGDYSYEYDSKGKIKGVRSKVDGTLTPIK